MRLSQGLWTYNGHSCHYIQVWYLNYTGFQVLPLPMAVQFWQWNWSNTNHFQNMFKPCCKMIFTLKLAGTFILLMWATVTSDGTKYNKSPEDLFGLQWGLFIYVFKPSAWGKTSWVLAYHWLVVYNITFSVISDYRTTNIHLSKEDFASAFFPATLNKTKHNSRLLGSK